MRHTEDVRALPSTLTLSALYSPAAPVLSTRKTRKARVMLCLLISLLFLVVNNFVDCGYVGQFQLKQGLSWGWECGSRCSFAELFGLCLWL